MQAQVEYDILRNIQASVKGMYKNGKPLHHLDSARSTVYSSDSSNFFVTTMEDFQRLTAHEVQEIFRHRHILIPGTPPKNVKFDRAGLSNLSSLTAKREIQGEFFIPASEFEC
jgi:hypothetical protein